MLQPNQIEEILCCLAPVKLAIEGVLDAHQGGIYREPLSNIEAASLNRLIAKAYYSLEKEFLSGGGNEQGKKNPRVPDKGSL